MSLLCFQGSPKITLIFTWSSPLTPFLHVLSPLSFSLARQEFSLPSITLFERCGLRGKRVILTDGSVNLRLAGGCSRVQSVLVEGGMWVHYKCRVVTRSAGMQNSYSSVSKFSSWCEFTGSSITACVCFSTAEWRMPGTRETECVFFYTRVLWVMPVGSQQILIVF